MSRCPRRPPMRAKSGRAGEIRPKAQLGHLATGFAIRRGVAYRRNQRSGSVLGGGGRLPALGYGHHDPGGNTANCGFSRCISRRGAGAGNRTVTTGAGKTCATLRAQIGRLKTWADARRAEGMPFVILGDFNRRLAQPEDWAWSILSPPPAPLFLLTANVSGFVAIPVIRHSSTISRLAVAAPKQCWLMAPSVNGRAGDRIPTTALCRRCSGWGVRRSRRKGFAEALTRSPDQSSRRPETGRSRARNRRLVGPRLGELGAGEAATLASASLKASPLPAGSAPASSAASMKAAN